MKILVIGQYYPPDVGGSHRRTYNAVMGLEQKGHEIEIVTAFPHYPLGKVPPQYNRKIISAEYEGAHRLIRVWLPRIAHQGFAKRLFMYILFCFTSLLALPIVKRPDVIWAASPSIFSSFPAKIYSIIKRAPIVRNVDDLWPETAAQLGYLNKTLQRIGEYVAMVAYQNCSAVTPISSAYNHTLKNKYRIRSHKLFVAEVGVDTTIFKVIEKGYMKKAFFEIVYSGLLGIAYDFETIIEAAILLRRTDNIRFLIRGIGEMEDFIRNKIKENCLDNVTLSTDFLEQDTLIELLSCADALILPMKDHESSDTGIPTKLFEYMACGRPIICISSGPSARIVLEANCGVVVPQNNPSALSTVIQELKAQSNLEDFGINGREYVEAHYSLKRIAAKLEEAFRYAIHC